MLSICYTHGFGLSCLERLLENTTLEQTLECKHDCTGELLRVSAYRDNALDDMSYIVVPTGKTDKVTKDYFMSVLKTIVQDARDWGSKGVTYRLYVPDRKLLKSIVRSKTKFDYNCEVLSGDLKGGINTESVPDFTGYIRDNTVFIAFDTEPALSGGKPSDTEIEALKALLPEQDEPIDLIVAQDRKLALFNYKWLKQAKHNGDIRFAAIIREVEKAPFLVPIDDFVSKYNEEIKRELEVLKSLEESE